MKINTYSDIVSKEVWLKEKYGLTFTDYRNIRSSRVRKTLHNEYLKESGQGGKVSETGRDYRDSRFRRYAISRVKDRLDKRYAENVDNGTDCYFEKVICRNFEKASQFLTKFEVNMLYELENPLKDIVDAVDAMPERNRSDLGFTLDAIHILADSKGHRNN